jgi:hypothetical protein
MRCAIPACLQYVRLITRTHNTVLCTCLGQYVMDAVGDRSRQPDQDAIRTPFRGWMQTGSDAPLHAWDGLHASPLLGVAEIRSSLLNILSLARADGTVSASPPSSAYVGSGSAYCLACTHVGTVRCDAHTTCTWTTHRDGFRQLRSLSTARYACRASRARTHARTPDGSRYRAYARAYACVAHAHERTRAVARVRVHCGTHLNGF